MKPEFKRLREWEKELNICIRCGYCYELCPLFKADAWEVNTPRAKLVLLFRMLNDEVECTPELVDKIAECFHCRNCERSCAANVEVTEIIRAAKADFADAGFDFRGTAAVVDDDVCGHCGVCTSVCKAGAITIEGEERKRVVDPVECTSCGVCVAACPSGAISQKEGFNILEEDLRGSMLASLAGGGSR